MSQDEGFREIQLNGKQLVFLFMAVTVVSVVIFLLGVLVGRGVRAERPATAEEQVAAAPVAPDSGPTPAAAAPQAPAAEPPPPTEELTYFDRLQKKDTPSEKLKPSSNTPPEVAESPAPAARGVAAPPVQAPHPETHPAASPIDGPTGPGFAVQVMTFPDRQGADTLAKELIKKGYPAFVAGPVPSGGRTIYRVRVGKYRDRHEAESVSHRLETEEQFKPWIAR